MITKQWGKYVKNAENVTVLMNVFVNQWTFSVTSKRGEKFRKLYILLSLNTSKDTQQINGLHVEHWSRLQFWSISILRGSLRDPWNSGISAAIVLPIRGCHLCWGVLWCGWQCAWCLTGHEYLCMALSVPWSAAKNDNLD